MKKYEVRIVETWSFWGLVEVEASTEKEAEEKAFVEGFDISWDCSDLETRDVVEVSEM